MSHSLSGIDTRRDPARERLAPLLLDLKLARARERSDHRFALRMPLPRRIRRPREEGASCLSS
jgi:hypothetical protein